jgi:hypothetical protein
MFQAYYDVAVLGIKQVTFSQFVLPICLPPMPSLNPEKYDDKTASTLGPIKKDSFGTPLLTSASVIIYKYQ